MERTSPSKGPYLNGIREHFRLSLRTFVKRRIRTKKDEGNQNCDGTKKTSPNVHGALLSVLSTFSITNSSNSESQIPSCDSARIAMIIMATITADQPYPKKEVFVHTASDPEQEMCFNGGPLSEEVTRPLKKPRLHWERRLREGGSREEEYHSEGQAEADIPDVGQNERGGRDDDYARESGAPVSAAIVSDDEGDHCDEGSGGCNGPRGPQLPPQVFSGWAQQRGKKRVGSVIESAAVRGIRHVTRHSPLAPAPSSPEAAGARQQQQRRRATGAYFDGAEISEDSDRTEAFSQHILAIFVAGEPVGGSHPHHRRPGNQSMAGPLPAMPCLPHCAGFQHPLWKRAMSWRHHRPVNGQLADGIACSHVITTS